MKRPNYEKWITLECVKRGLEYMITNAEFKSASDQDMVKVLIGFRGSSTKQIEIRGSILHIRTTDRVFYRIAKFLKEHETIMI